MGSRWKRMVVIAGSVVLAVAAVGLVVHLASSPRGRSTGALPPSSPRATKTAPITPPPGTGAGSPSPPASSAPTRSPAAGPPVVAPSAPATPRPTATGLIATPYGFSYPAGWSPGPLLTRSPQVQTETVTAPAGGGRIDYLKDTSPAAYNPDHTVNDVAIESAIEAAFPCAQIVTTTPVPNKGFRYTCSATTGIHVAGMALFAPYAQGFRLLQVTMPPADDPLSAAILAGFH